MQDSNGDTLEVGSYVRRSSWNRSGGIRKGELTIIATSGGDYSRPFLVTGFEGEGTLMHLRQGRYVYRAQPAFVEKMTGQDIMAARLAGTI